MSSSEQTFSTAGRAAQAGAAGVSLTSREAYVWIFILLLLGAILYLLGNSVWNMIVESIRGGGGGGQMQQPPQQYPGPANPSQGPPQQGPPPGWGSQNGPVRMRPVSVQPSSSGGQW